MKRNEFLKAIGFTALAISATGFKLIESDGLFKTDCATTSDMLGPFFRKNAPFRNDITYSESQNEEKLKVIGRVFGADCKTPLSDVVIDVWHCDHQRNYDMTSEEFRCRGKLKTDRTGDYSFKTFLPPRYAGRPKHIHYLIQGVEGFETLITQLYFRGERKTRKLETHPKYAARVLEIYENGEGESEVRLDLYLSPSKKE